MKFKTTGTTAIIILAVIGTVLAVSFRPVAVEAAYPVERAKQTFVRKVCSRISGMFRGAAASAENPPRSFTSKQSRTARPSR